MVSRRRFLSRSALGILGLSSSAVAFSADDEERLPDGHASKGMITAEAERAIEAGTI